MKPPRTRTRGFTLLEVLVALVVISVALLAGARASESVTFNAIHHQQQMAAQWCVHNALVATRLRGQMPDVGKRTEPCEQGPFRFDVSIAVWTTPNPNFRRVAAQASLKGQVLASLSTVIGGF